MILLRLNMLLFAFIILCLQTFSQEKSTIISGVVQDDKGQLIANATVLLKGSAVSVMADEKGFYSINNVPEGKHKLLITAVGYQSKEISLVAGKNALQTIDIVLVSSAAQMQTVEITGRKNDGYKANYSFAATKVAIPVTEIPSTVSTITQQLIRDRQAVRFDDIARSTNVRVTNNGRSIVIRGFQSNTRLINGLRTLSENNRFSAISPVVESYEVVKGPSSSMFGSMSPGGVLNLVTKKPLAEKRQAVSVSAGSFNTVRGDLDFTGKVTDDGTVLYRLNMFGQLSDTWQKNMKDNAFTIAPSFSFMPREGTRINVDINHTNLLTMENDGIFPFINKKIDQTPIDFSVLQIGDGNKTTTTSVNFSLSQQIFKNISFNVSYLKDYLSWDDKRHTAELYLGTGAWTADSSISMAYAEWKANMDADNVTGYLSANMNTGKIKHKALIGYDYNVSLFNWGTYRYTTTPIGKVNVYDPAKSSSLDGETYSLTAIAYDRTNKTRDFASGVYFQDQVTITERIKVLLGLRYESYTFRLAYQTPQENEVSQKAWLPKIGLTYSFPSYTHVYGSYITGFQPVSSGSLLFGTVEGGGELKPEYSNQFELGVKQELFNKDLLLTVAAYQIQKTNVTQQINPGVPNANDRIYRQIGEVTSKGIEVEFNGRVSRSFSLSGAYNYNDSKITEDINPVKINEPLGLAPKHQGNLWAKYEVVSNGPLHGFGLGAGISVSSKTPMLQAPTVTTPGYGVVDAAISYRLNRVLLNLNINNITDKRYYTGAVRERERYYTGAPRNIMFRVGYML